MFASGQFINSSSLTLKFIKKESAAPRISFIVPKNVAKSAVTRNDLRRRGYSVIKKYLNSLPHGFVGAFVFKKTLTLDELDYEIKAIFNKIN